MYQVGKACCNAFYFAKLALPYNFACSVFPGHFGGKFPDGGFFPFIQELPVADLETGDLPLVKGANFFQAPLKDWLIAIIEKRFHWEDGAWLIET